MGLPGIHVIEIFTQELIHGILSSNSFMMNLLLKLVAKYNYCTNDTLRCFSMHLDVA